MSGHDLFAPSAAPVWGHCSGSIIAAQAAPSPDTEQSRAGTAAHWVSAECLKSWKDGGPYDPREYIGVTCPENGVVIDQEHAEGADVYVSDVVDTLSPIPGGREALLVEFKVSMPTVHARNSGTLDAAAVFPRFMHIWDYKNGHGRVGAAGNLQLVDYLEGLRLRYNIDGFEAQQTQTFARVVQPFSYGGAGPVDNWVFTLSDLRPYVNQLHAKAMEAELNPSLTSGPHCRYCPARGRCPALRGASYNLIDVSNAPLAFDEMTSADLAIEREILQRGAVTLKARLEAIEDDLTHRVKSGDKDCGLSLESVPGRTVWAVPPATAIGAASLLGVDIAKPGCDTPAQAAAKVPVAMRDAFKAAIKPLTKCNRSLKLVSTADTLAARAFRK